ncbi:hypothetical protein AYO47_01790 [Planctomyces sp. SCGC AG-212-M04]|nr:hypothetical protein AYO47_01790 [Planctomyces sp. SCGC AG-212-M04]
MVLVLAATVQVQAQHKARGEDDHAALSESEIQRISDELSRDLGAYEEKRSRQESAINSQVDQLSDQRATLEPKIDFFNNVTSLRKKDDLDRWVEEAKVKWQADGRRIGVINGFTGESFYRYYNKEGELVVSRVKGDYDMLKQQQEAWDRSYQKAKWAAAELNNDYEKVEQTYGRVTAIKAQYAAQREAQLAAEQAERDRQRLELEQQQREEELRRQQEHQQQRQYQPPRSGRPGYAT